jgi:hypothetical protein
MIFRTSGKRVEVQRQNGYVFIRFPFLGELFWDERGVQRWPWRTVKAQLAQERIAQQRAWDNVEREAQQTSFEAERLA